MNTIKWARLVEGLTQKELGDKLGVSGVTVCKWETGKITPAPRRLKRISDVLHISVDRLISDPGGGETDGKAV